MSSLNFFEQFAAINVSGSSSVVEQDLVKNMSTIHLDEQNQDAIHLDEQNQDVEKMNKTQKNLKNEQKTKKYRFIHGNNVIMTNGQYKGYNCFVYDYFPSMASVSMDEEIYVLAQQYGEKKIGDEIVTSSGSGKILSKIGALLNVCFTDVQDGGDIRLPRFCFARYVTFMDNSILKIAQLLKIHGNQYEMVVMDLPYNKQDKQDLVNMVSDSFKSGEFSYGARVMVSASNCGDEFYFVCKHPENPDELDYYGRYGRLRLEIPEQYLVSVKRTVTVNKSMTSTQGKRVKVERGLYKNKEGDLVNVESAYLNVQIEALNKKITSHYARLPNGNFQIRKIIPSDVFFIDLELMNGNYFQVEECYADYYIGFERSRGCVEKKTISKVDVKSFMSGFTITDTKFVSSFEKQTEEKFVLDTIQEDQEVQDDEVVETDNVDYENGFDENGFDENIVDQFENTEGQMKETFRDIERSGFVQRSLSKDEREYMKMIEKCGSAIGDIQDSYVLLDKISDAVKMMRSELEKISIVDWSSSDVKYIVACLVAYEILKTGYPMTIYEFRKYVQKLYDTNYLNKSSIANSGFVRCESLSSDSLWKSIEMTNEEKQEFKTLYKNQKYGNLVRDIMERCHKMLCVWFEPVVFSKGGVELELIKVSESKHIVKDYPKYFLTTSDIVNNVTSKDAKKILWGPNSQKLVNVWKTSLDKKLEKEDNKTAKCIYEFVKDNIDNAPFVLPTLEKSEDKLDKLKYKELKRAFETFTEKLRVHVGKQKDEKNMRLEQSMQESMRIAKKRMEMSKKRNRDETTETTDSEFVKRSSCKIFIE
jgi:hypothetical protein